VLTAITSFSLLTILTVLVALVISQGKLAEETKIAQNRFSRVRGLGNSILFDVHDAVVRSEGPNGAAGNVILAIGEGYLTELDSIPNKDHSVYLDAGVGYNRIGKIYLSQYYVDRNDTLLFRHAYAHHRAYENLLPLMEAGVPSPSGLFPFTSSTVRLAEFYASRGDSASAEVYIFSAKVIENHLDEYELESHERDRLAILLYSGLAAVSSYLGRFNETIEYADSTIRYGNVLMKAEEFATVQSKEKEEALYALSSTWGSKIEAYQQLQMHQNELEALDSWLEQQDTILQMHKYSDRTATFITNQVGLSVLMRNMAFKASRYATIPSVWALCTHIDRMCSEAIDQPGAYSGSAVQILRTSLANSMWHGWTLLYEGMNQECIDVLTAAIESYDSRVARLGLSHQKNLIDDVYVGLKALRIVALRNIGNTDLALSEFSSLSEKEDYLYILRSPCKEALRASMFYSIAMASAGGELDASKQELLKKAATSLALYFQSEPPSKSSVEDYYPFEHVGLDYITMLTAKVGIELDKLEMHTSTQLLNSSVTSPKLDTVPESPYSILLVWRSFRDNLVKGEGDAVLKKLYEYACGIGIEAFFSSNQYDWRSERGINALEYIAENYPLLAGEDMHGSETSLDIRYEDERQSIVINDMTRMLVFELNQECDRSAFEYFNRGKIDSAALCIGEGPFSTFAELVELRSQVTPQVSELSWVQLRLIYLLMTPMWITSERDEALSLFQRELNRLAIYKSQSSIESIECSMAWAGLLSVMAYFELLTELSEAPSRTLGLERRLELYSDAFDAIESTKQLAEEIGASPLSSTERERLLQLEMQIDSTWNSNIQICRNEPGVFTN